MDAERASGPRAPRKWVLVVDDHLALRSTWLEGLEAAGYAAVGCGDGIEAVELMRDVRPDLVLLDLHMPRASGWDFLETVRENPRWHAIPVLVVSGHLDEDPGLPPGVPNVVGRLRKPIGLNDLLSRVREAVG